MAVNPYIAGNPVTSSEMFFGRADVFEFVRANLIGRHQDNVLVLHGQRRTGKTSVLYQMHRFIDPSYLPILVDIQGMTLERVSGFLWELAYTIQRGLRRPHGIRLPRPGRHEYQQDARHEFQSIFLPQVQEAIGGRRLLLMFDEAELLYDKVRAGQLEADAFRYLSNLMQHHSFLAFLFTIGSKLEQMQAEFATLFRVALYKEISFLDRESAVSLITEPVREHYTYAAGAVERIYTITSGHPYYTQLLCHELFNRWQQVGFSMVTDDEINAVLPRVIEAGTSNLRYIWEESSSAEKAIMAVLKECISDESKSVTHAELESAMREHGIPIPAGELAHGLQDLALRDVIGGREPYSFRVDLMRRWLKQHAPIEWVKDEIKPDIAAWRRESIAPAHRRRRWIGVWATALVMIAIVLGGVLYINRPIDPERATTLTIEAATRQRRIAAAQTRAALVQDPAARATATAERARLEAIYATQTADCAIGRTATAQAAATTTMAAIQTATAQPTFTSTPTHTPPPTDTPTPTDTPLPTPTPTITPSPLPTDTPTSTPSPSGGGRLVFVMGGEVHTSNPDGSDHRRLTFNGAAEHDPAWSPDGRYIAYYSNITGNGEIWVMDAEGDNARQLTHNQAEDLYPAWSPDGTRIVFVSERDNTRELYIIPAAGGTPKRITHNNIDESYPAWSPDGSTIAFAGRQLGQGGMWTIRADGSNGDNPTKISGIPGNFADLEWIGERIYFAAAATKYGADYNIYSVLPDGSGWSFHATGPGDDRSPTWSPGMTQMAFTNSNNLYITPPGPVRLFDNAIEPDWSPQ